MSAISQKTGRNLIWRLRLAGFGEEEIDLIDGAVISELLPIVQRRKEALRIMRLSQPSEVPIDEPKREHVRRAPPAVALVCP